MTEEKDIAAEKDYLTWLHELTIEGYKQNVYISTAMDKIIDRLFKEGKSPQEVIKYLQSKL